MLGLGSWGTSIPEDIGSWQWNASHDDVIEGSARPAMVNSLTSQCTEVRTLDAPDSIVGDGTMSDRGGLANILTRRLGLIGQLHGFRGVRRAHLGVGLHEDEEATVDREEGSAALVQSPSVHVLQAFLVAKRRQG